MLIVIIEKIPGKVYEVIGEAFGSVTQSRNAVSDFGAGVKNIFGGEIRGYTKMINTPKLSWQLSHHQVCLVANL